MSDKPPILTWLRDPGGQVWAIDAANVMRKDPGQIPVRDASWEELDRYVPAGTMAASGAEFEWHMGPIRMAVVRWWADFLNSFRSLRRKP